jgi:hypothetical protein
MGEAGGGDVALAEVIALGGVEASRDCDGVSTMASKGHTDGPMTKSGLNSRAMGMTICWKA